MGRSNTSKEVELSGSEGGVASDSVLIERWQAGDEAAATELVRRHAPALARYLGASGGRDDVDDLVQEAFFRAFRSIGSFRGSASFRTWLITIGSNLLKDLWRSEQRRPETPVADLEPAGGGSDPHQEMVASELEERMARAVRELPEMQREVFLMRAQQGMEYEEIAVALETSKGAARVHYHHAVKRLKELMD